MDWGFTVTDVIFNLLITAFGYLLVPIIVILKGKKYDAKKLKKINRINCVVVWILFRIIRTAISGEPGTGAAVFLWGAIGQWLLNMYCLKCETSTPKSIPQPTTQASQDHICLSNEEESAQTYKPHLTTGADVALTQDIASSPTPMQHKVTPKPAEPTKQTQAAKPIKHIKYCSRCGSIIDSVTKKCTGCGKQYFRGFRLSTVLLTLAFLISLYGNYLLYVSNVDLQTEVSNLEKIHKALELEKSNLANNLKNLKEDKKDLQLQLYENSVKVHFYDKYIVFVIEGDKKYYHHYDCEKFQSCESFWAYNIEAAKDKKYKPCSLCCD